MEDRKKAADDTGLMAALEFINAKGDTDEMQDIVEPEQQQAQPQQKQNNEKATS